MSHPQCLCTASCFLLSVYPGADYDNPGRHLESDRLLQLRRLDVLRRHNGRTHHHEIHAQRRGPALQGKGNERPIALRVAHTGRVSTALFENGHLLNCMLVVHCERKCCLATCVSICCTAPRVEVVLCISALCGRGWKKDLRGGRSGVKTLPEAVVQLLDKKYASNSARSFGHFAQVALVRKKQLPMGSSSLKFLIKDKFKNS